jgi:hypothetical protein
MRAKILLIALSTIALFIAVVRFDLLNSKEATDFILMIATVMIALFAYSTDRAYHRIADIAAKLSTIVEQQSQIIAARDEPIISGRIITVFDKQNGETSDHLEIINSGPPITELSVTTAELFEVSFGTIIPRLKSIYQDTLAR